MTQAICAYPLFAVNLLSHALENCTIYRLFDEALIDLLVVKTYTHGTSPSSAYGILWSGAQPRLGGRPNHGEHAIYKTQNFARTLQGDMDCRGKFFMWQEDAYSYEGDSPCALCESTPTSAKNSARDFANNTTKAEHKLAGYSQFDCIASYTPTLTFRFSPEEVGHFRADASYGYTDEKIDKALAVYTREPISPDHLGLYGTLAHGLNSSICARISAHPDRFMRGLCKLAWAVMLTALVVLGLTISPVSAFFIMVYLAVETAQCVASLAVLLFADCCAPQELEEIV